MVLSNIMVTNDVIIVPAWYLLLLIGIWLFRRAVTRVIEELKTKKRRKKHSAQKEEKKILPTDVYDVDPEDSNLLISKANPKIKIRIISRGKDEATMGVIFPHLFSEEDEEEIKKEVPEVVHMFTQTYSHDLPIIKSFSSNWEDIHQRIIDFVFKKLEGKYPVE